MVRIHTLNKVDKFIKTSFIYKDGLIMESMLELLMESIKKNKKILHKLI